MNSLISLNGAWEVNIGEQCFEACVPGCWDTLIESKALAGPVWYTKKIFIPNSKNENNQWLIKFDAVSYYCEVYLNDIYTGSHEGMWDNFYFNVTKHLRYGEENIIRLKIYKQGYDSEDKFRFREVLSGFIPDVGCTFGGIWGSVTLEERPDIFIENAYIEPDVENKAAKVYVKLNNTREKQSSVSIKACVKDGERSITESTHNIFVNPLGIRKYEFVLELEEFTLWDMDNPYLYNMEIKIEAGDEAEDKITKRFGMRDIRADGEKILLNGIPVYIRGILHWGYYPDLICSNPSEAAIRNEIMKAKEMGFNAIKHCLYIPRQEYFDLSDELGMLTWLELPLWLPDVTPELKGRIKFEYPRIIEQVAGHPSLIMASLGCELDASVEADILEEMYNLVKQTLGRILVRDNSGSGECYGGLTVDYADFYDYHFYSDLHNLENLIETFTPQWRKRRPWVFGEFNDIDTYRDLNFLTDMHTEKELWWSKKHDENNPISSVKPDFFIHLQKERLKLSSLENDGELLRSLSIKHAILHRKYTLELTRQFPEICGYNITAIRDVPIATSGIFDDNLNLKFNPGEFKKFNGEIVLSPAWDLRRTWINGDRVFNKDRFNYFSGDDFGMYVVISNYSRNALKNPEVAWRIFDEQDVIAEQTVKMDKNIEIGAVEELINIRTKLPLVFKPRGLWISVSLIHEGLEVQNQWRIWVYPKNLLDVSDKKVFLYDTLGILEPLKRLYRLNELKDEEEIIGDAVITTRLTPAIERYLKKGGKVFYIQRGEGYLPHVKCSFWREGFNRYYEHEILRSMPVDDYMDFQYFGLGTDTAIDSLKIENENITKVKPIIRRVDSRQYLVSDYMVEMDFGRGRLVASTLRFEGGMGKQPSSLSNNNAGVFIIDQILRYFQGA